MTENNIKHFEQLWDESEQLTSKVHAAKSNNEILNSILALLNDYKDISTMDVPIELKTSLKHRHMGEIMFLITSIAARDNINVYAALMEEMKLNA